MNEECQISVGIVGGGSAGLFAAISAAMQGAKVCVYEQKDVFGKKILASGNGKCNVSNRKMHTHCFLSYEESYKNELTSQISVQDTLAFFEQIGLITKEKRDGYIYPYSEQAATVRDVLLAACFHYHITMMKNVSITQIITPTNHVTGKWKGMFLLQDETGRQYAHHRIVLATGSNAGTKRQDSSLYHLAMSCGHSLTAIRPALTQISCCNNPFIPLAGVRCEASLSLFLNKKQLHSEHGELQFTEFGLSGIPAFQISLFLAYHWEAKEKMRIRIDFLPAISEDSMYQKIVLQKQLYPERLLITTLSGMIHSKVATWLVGQYVGEKRCLCEQTDEQIRVLIRQIKAYEVTIHALHTMDKAQVATGGVRLTEITESMESVYAKGLFLCGEMLDITGICGGYNLQWAWHSGQTAGFHAGKEDV